MRLKLGKEVVMVISDLQIPFHHQDAFKFLEAVKIKYKPTKIVCIGDSLDCNALSKYVKDPDGRSAGDELNLSKSYLTEFWRIFPTGVEVQSNHNIRAWKRAFEAGIPKSFLKPYSEVVGAPKSWKFTQQVVIDGVVYEHGDAFQGQYAAKTAALTNMKSTVIGHHHANGSIHWISNKDQMIFGMNVGCLIDMDSYAFEYAKAYKFKPTLMCGVVSRGIPELIPFVMNSNDRWISNV